MTDSTSTTRSATRPGAEAFVAFGANRDARLERLRAGRASLAAEPGLEVRAASRVYSSEPVGPGRQRAYLNAVVQVVSAIDAFALLAVLQRIEVEQGRERGPETVRWGSRTLDLDLLLFDDARLSTPDLEVPHPRMPERAFVLEPLCELAADRVHPRLGETFETLRGRCPRILGDAVPAPEIDATWRRTGD